MKRRTGAFWLVVVVLVAAGGCGRGDAGSSDAVRMLDNRFDPLDFSVTVGEAVDFLNDGRVDHNVIAADGSFDSTVGGANQKPGETWTHTFDGVGTFDYYCSLHAVQDGDGEWQGMVGTITVTEPNDGESGDE